MRHNCSKYSDYCLKIKVRRKYQENSIFPLAQLPDTLNAEKRYGEMQRLKTINTIFLEAQLFKNRMVHLYKILEKKSQDPKVNGNECAKCCEVAANIAIDVLKMESEGIKAVKEGLGRITEAAKVRSSLSVNLDSDPMDELEKSC
jgi:hypothetical protein